ncbi:DsbA family protein [Flexistipes sp.]|uniref:DsbA family protein n=1 Tax=Flexistipes sp. TaxID=3088135 RepID=UPI002E1B6FDC|nr:thioredoxin domain-containing protein [Flexistipes sp.]
MKRIILAALVILLGVAVYAATAGIKEDIAEKVTQNFKNNGVKNPNVEVKVIKKLEKSEVYLVKLKITGDNLKRVLEQHVLSDGSYIYPEAIDMVSGKKILQDFKAEINKVSFSQDDLEKMVFVKGTKGAENIIVVADDFECPFCRRAHFFMNDILKNIPEENYAFYVLNYPLRMHKKAEIFAKIHYAAAEMGYDLMDEIFHYVGKGDYKNLSEEEIIDYFAKKTKNGKQFKKIVGSKEAEKNLEWNINKGKSLNISGTPAIFVNGKRIDGFNRQKTSEYLNQIK